MAGLGLMNAVQGYMRGKQFADQQQELEHQKRKRAEEEARQADLRAKLEEANKAFGGVIDSSKAKWAIDGAPGSYAPNEETLFRAAEARGATLAKHGMWDQFMQNEAQVAPLRGRARLKAVQRYEMDGDAEALARSIYPTLFDGKQLVGVKRDDGNGTGPAALQLEMSDGSKHVMPVDQLHRMAKVAADPEALKREALLNFERAKAEIFVDRHGKVAKARGDEAIRVDNAKTQNQTGLAVLNNASRERINAGRDEAIKQQAHGRERAAAGSRRAASDPSAAPVPQAQSLGDGLTLLPDAADAEQPPRPEQAMGAARREAATTRKPVEFNLGGQQGMLTRDGGLADAKPAKDAPGVRPAKLPAKKPAAEADPEAKQSATKGDKSPPAKMLKEGVRTKFANGQTWTLRDGKPVQIN